MKRSYLGGVEGKKAFGEKSWRRQVLEKDREGQRGKAENREKEKKQILE